MEKFFTVSQTAEIVGVTAETLRHYDRIGLVRPCKTDKWTNYRYYSENEIVRLNTIKALRYMDLSLEEIKKVLGLEDFNAIVSALDGAILKADKKIEQLKDARARIERAKNFYANMSARIDEHSGHFLRNLNKRVILLAENLTVPTVDNLHNYHRHFYALLDEKVRDKFSFEDTAGIYTSDKGRGMFAICSQYEKTDELKILPQGDYLCAECYEENYDETVKALYREALKEYGANPPFSLAIIVLTGILKWKYEVQIPITK